VTSWLYDFLFISQAGWWVGGIGIYLEITCLAALLVSRYGGVRMGPDPVIPLSEAPTVELPVKPNYVPEFRLHEYYPLAPEVDVKADITSQLTAVAAFFERTETVTVTREVVVAFPAARHRLEDVHAETRNLTESIRRARVLEAGKPQ
jgi:hypothetical protein